MINFNNVSFVKSTPNVAEAPRGSFPEVLLVGRSNVGKSTLINSLCGRKNLAFTSSKPGHTRLLNYFNVDDKLYLVDAPGYGYAKGGFDLDKLFMEMMDDYFANAHNMRLVLLLIDSRRELNEDDVDLINYFFDKEINFQIVVTKVDKINQKEKAAFIKNLREVGIRDDEIVFTSSLKTHTLDALKSIISNHI